jgi:hypothetical protein
MSQVEDNLPISFPAIPAEASSFLLADVRIPIAEPYRKESFDVVSCRMRMAMVKGYRVAMVECKQVPKAVLFAFKKGDSPCLVIVEDLEFDAD